MWGLEWLWPLNSKLETDQNHFFQLRLGSNQNCRQNYIFTCDCEAYACVRLSVERVYCDKTKAHSEKSSIMTNRKSPTSFPMSLRWTSYISPNPKGGLKSDFFHFPYKKLCFSRRKSATKFLCVKTFNSKVARHSLAYRYLSVPKGW